MRGSSKTYGTTRARRAALDGWRASGLTQAEYCRRKGIHPATFSGWKRTHALWIASEAARQSARPAAFVEARVVDGRRQRAPVDRHSEPLGAELPGDLLGAATTANGESGITVAAGRGRLVINVSRGFDGETLKRVITIIAEDTA